MKRLVYSSKQANNRSRITASADASELRNILSKNGIDDTTCIYKMTRWNDGEDEVLRFKCKGDWLACFAMVLLETPTPDSLAHYFGGLGEVADLARKYNTADKLLSAVGQLWALPDEYSAVTDLTNLTTGRTLWHLDDNSPVDEIEEDIDW